MYIHCTCLYTCVYMYIYYNYICMHECVLDYTHSNCLGGCVCVCVCVCVCRRDFSTTKCLETTPPKRKRERA